MLYRHQLAMTDVSFVCSNVTVLKTAYRAKVLTRKFFVPISFGLKWQCNAVCSIVKLSRHFIGFFRQWYLYKFVFRKTCYLEVRVFKDQDWSKTNFWHSTILYEAPWISFSSVQFVPTVFLSYFTFLLQCCWKVVFQIKIRDRTIQVSQSEHYPVSRIFHT